MNSFSIIFQSHLSFPYELQVFTSSVMAYKNRHLSDLWNQYWVHELGFCDSESFDIKQMCLGKFEGKHCSDCNCWNLEIGHNNAVKGFDVLNCENGFLSYGKDRTVKLFSCADIDYCNVSNEVVSRFSYVHQKPVTHAMFMEQLRMAISVDSLVHLWDPFMGKKVNLQISSGLYIPEFRFRYLTLRWEWRCPIGAWCVVFPLHTFKWQLPMPMVGCK